MVDETATTERTIEYFLTIHRNLATEDKNFDIQLNIDSGNGSDEDEAVVTGEECGAINSYDEALKLVHTLKLFAREDFTAFQHIKELETHFQIVLKKKMCSSVKLLF